MHEVAIIRDIINTLEKHYEGRINQISKVRVEAGQLSNVQPILIQNAYEAVIIDDSRWADIDLEVVSLPIIAFCSSCNKNFEVVRHKFVCSCGRASKKIVQGEELRISQVTFK